jgi:transcription elongation factor SPT5
MAVKGKGKQVAAESPGPGAGGASGSGGKRRKATGEAGAGPSSSSAAKRRRRAGVLQFVDDVAGVDDDYEEEEDELGLESEDDPDDGEYGSGSVPEACVRRGWVEGIHLGFVFCAMRIIWADDFGYIFFYPISVT